MKTKIINFNPHKKLLKEIDKMIKNIQYEQSLISNNWYKIWYEKNKNIKLQKKKPELKVVK